MRGDAAGQVEEGPEPVDLGVGIVGDLLPAIGAAKDGAGGDEDDLVESVDAALFAAGVGQVGEMIEDRGGVMVRGMEAVSELTVMVQTSLNRCGYPDDRWYKRGTTPSQPGCKAERVAPPYSPQTPQADA